LLLAALLFAGSGLISAAPVAVDRIVAVVNNSVITQHELQSRVVGFLRQLSVRKPDASPPPRAVLEKQILEQMIRERVLLQMAEETNIRVDAGQLDRIVANIAANNKLGPEEFRKAVEAEGTDFNAFREQIRTEVTITRLREREVENRVSVSEAEIDNYLANPAKEINDEYRLAHIQVATPEGASPETLAELKARADKVMTELKAGADFAQTAATYSDAQNALQGGLLDWRSEAQLPSLFVSALKGLQPGQIGELIRSPSGFHILKLVDKRGKDVQYMVKQTRARHILVKTNEVVSDEDAKTRLLQLRERIEHGGDFAELAKLHSDDLSAAQGGELPWLNPGDTVPEFERTMQALQVNELSQPVRSPFGWHLIQVQERRDQDMTRERQRLEARRAIRERKIEEAADDWVRQARDSAYVEYHLEE
jgi:peptidyl-prolyl cis-trans isomerase SurA